MKGNCINLAILFKHLLLIEKQIYLFARNPARKNGERIKLEKCHYHPETNRINVI